jgi:hypothetical protein
MASPEEITIAINKDIGGTLRDISIKMSYDNRPGFVQNTWLAELLLDGRQVEVPVHSYPEEIATPNEDSIAIVRAQADIINSKQMVSDLTGFLAYATNISEADASGIINELVEIANSKENEIYRLCPQISSEMDRLNAEKAKKGILFKFEGKFSNIEHSKEFIDTVTKLNVLSNHVFQISLNS